MDTVEPRKNFVASIISSYLGLSSADVSVNAEVTENPFLSIAESSEVTAFLDNPSCSVLQAFSIRSESGAVNVSLSNSLSFPAECSAELHFTKLKPEAVALETIGSSITISSMLQSPITSLFHNLRSVYAPLLLKDPKWSSQFDPKLQNLLSELEAGLGCVVRRGGPAPEPPAKGKSSKAAALDYDSRVDGILDPQDEFAFWADIAGSQSWGDTEVSRARAFCEKLEPLRKEFSSLSDKSLEDTIESLQSIQYALDDLWRTVDVRPYSEARMQHLLSVVGGSLGRHVQSKCGAKDLLQSPFAEVRRSLELGIQILDRWVELSEQLTTQDWLDDTHTWSAGKHKDAFVEHLWDRMQKVLALRTAHEQLLQLLSKTERQELQVDSVFAPFRGIQPLFCNAYSEPIWARALSEYERKMAPIERRIAEKLRGKLSGARGDDSSGSSAGATIVNGRGGASSAMTVLAEFQRYEELLQRPGISKELSQERTLLLTQMRAHLDALNDEYRTRQQGDAPSTGADVAGRNTPDIVSRMVWCRQLRKKVEQVGSTGSTLLSDLSKFAEFRSQCDSLVQDLTDFERDSFRAWCREVQEMLSEESGSFFSGNLLEIDHKDGKLKVQYSERLVSLQREVRQLSALGFTIPSAIQRANQTAEKFYRHGVVLKQVANFYNSIDKQMIPSQKPMLIDAAMAFEQVVSSSQQSRSKRTGSGGSAVTWDNAKDMEEYVKRLQIAAERLTTENRKLRKFHETLGEKIVNLMNIDLVRQQAKWKEGVAEVRGVFENLERQGYKNMDAWRRHWDHQLYKALEHQYQTGLETLNETLSEMKCDIVFKQGELQFKPPIESLREKYYQRLREFLSIPIQFKGVESSGSSELFRQMVERNSTGILIVYRKAEDLFSRLSKTRKRFKEHVVLGTVDVDKLVEETLSEVAQWEANFRSLKARGKEIEKIEPVIKVDCVTVSTAPIKAAIEDQLQRLSDSLVSSLRKAAQKHLAAIEDFLKDAMDTLSRRPQTVDEIGKANETYIALNDRKASIYAEFDKCDAKNRLLRTVASGSGVDLASVKAKWDKFEITLEAHQMMIKEQTETLKAGVEGRVLAFQGILAKFAARWHELKPKSVDLRNQDNAMKAIDFIKEKKEEVGELSKQAEALKTECKYFGVPETAVKVEDLSAVSEDIQRFQAMFALWEEYTTELGTLGGEDWISFRSKAYRFDDFLTAWTDKVRGIPAEASNAVVMFIKEQVNAHKEFSPMLKYLRGDGFTEDHWSQLFRLVGAEKGMTKDKLLFRHLLERTDSAVANMEALKTLHARAQGEVSIREALQELRQWDGDTNFSLVEHIQNGRRIMLIKEWKEIMTQVGDNQSLLQSLKDSPFFGPFSDEATSWEGKLAILDEYLHNLNAIQRKWVYLEPVFGRGALPQEQPRFQRVDKEFRGIMEDIEADPRVTRLARHSDLKDRLKSILEQLDRCQRALNDFLEEKRSKFPRFYFIGDDDLLEILGQAQNPTVIQSHLKKLFSGIHTVLFDGADTPIAAGVTTQPKTITAMQSLEGEVVTFKRPVAITDQVEVWMAKLDEEMRLTLRELLTECYNDKQINMTKYPSQILCLAELIHFTIDCERALQENRLEPLLRELRAKLQDNTSMDTEDDEVLELKVKALTFDIIHSIEVVELLISQRTNTVQDWLWQKQLRFYTDSKHGCVARMVNAQFPYTFEYQGNAARLVHTPLTDKCYLTLTQGMHLGYGGNPYGPAGTGKTESVKALAQALARQCLVFNCDEGIDFRSMGRIFIGLVKCGAWGCFDEFNRLKEDQLSAISQQIQIIQAAIKDKEPSIQLLGRTVEVNHNAGIFVTMNPAGKGYGGRSKLPDNLKALFRSVAMAVPDNELIAEVVLYSEGFQHARDVGRKLVSVFNLSKQLLSPQQHYDWGLRALKAVLRVGGQLIKAERKKAAQAGLQVDWLLAETQLIIKAVRVNTISKLTFDDAKRFNALLKDVFPGVDAPEIDYTELEKAVKETMEEMKLEIVPAQIRKILQFYEAAKTRIGVVLVGPSGSGKSTVWRVLRAALQKMGKVLVQHTFNPKSMPRNQLLGHMDMDTREWNDGVLTASARQVVKEPSDVHSWVISDGDIDPEWVESLNSVLDDNHLLTMPNGERIQFGPNVNFIFETHSLSYASPATVSRMGMIFLSEEDLDSRSLVASWLKRQPAESQSMLAGWIEDSFFRALDLISSSRSLVVETTLVGLVMSALSQIRGATCRSEYVQGLIRGLGGYLQLDLRVGFAKEMFSMCSESPADARKPLDSHYSRDSRCFVPYPVSSDLAEDFTFEDLIGRNPVVRTVEMQRSVAVIAQWLQTMEPFIVVGPEGCGKSMLLQHCFDEMKSVQVATVHCSAQTSSTHVIQKLTQSCGLFSTNQGRVYRPKESERLILYLKDLNLPKPDRYGTTQIVSFLQQLITYQGFYDDNLEWIGLERIQIVASMTPSTAMGRHPLSPRLTAIVRVLSVSYPEKDQLQAIYTAFTRAALSGAGLSAHPMWGSSKTASLLANMTVDLFEQVKKRFPTDEHEHYMFTPRDLTRWVLGLLRYDINPNPGRSGNPAAELLDAWAHEAQRLFRDRIVGSESRTRFDQLLLGSLRSNFNYEYKQSNNTFYCSWADAASAPPAAGTKGKTTSAPRARRLTAVTTQEYKTHVSFGMVAYQRENKDLPILLFPEMLENISHIDRVLSDPQNGSLLLAGRSGVGRRSIVTLAAHLLRCTLITPNMTKDYNIKSFKLDLRQAMQTAGIAGEPVCLLLEDHQLTDETFLECINSLLSAGEVPGLYAQEELDQLLSPLKELMAQEGVFQTLYSFFVSRVRRNLHIVLSMDPTHPLFATRCQSNPALFSQCSIQWMDAWSKESMRQIPLLLLNDLLNQDGPTALSSEIRPEVLTSHMLYMHESASQAVFSGPSQTGGKAVAATATPRQYVAFIELFKKLYTVKRSSGGQQQERLRAGLSKLDEAAKSVDELSRDAEQRKVLLAEKQRQADAALQEITQSMEKASEQKKEVESLKSRLAKEEKQMREKKTTIETQLKDIEPVLDAARQAVGEIRSDNISEIRSLKAPPPAIHDVLQAVLLLMGTFDTSWVSMKKFLGERGVKDRILTFDAREIKPEIRDSVEQLIRDKPSSFEHATIFRVSVAAAPLAAWVKANVEYSKVLDSVGPMEAEQQKLEESLARAKQKVEKCEKTLVQLDRKVAELKDGFAKRTAEAESLKIGLQKAEETLSAAQSLLGKLGGEKDRWEKQIAELNLQVAALPSQSLLSAAFITYLARAPEDIRKNVVNDWRRQLKLPEAAQGFLKFMTTESQLLLWKQQGLPADDLSFENAVSILESTQCPLIIDPSQQASEWLKVNLKAERSLEVTTPSDPRFANQLELAVRFGKTFVVEEIDKVEPLLYPILRKEFSRQGTRCLVQIGEKVIDYNEKFSLYLVTRNSALALPPDSASLVTEVNFSVTRAGLESQLLGVTIKNEQPELEEQKSKLLRQEEEYKMQLASLEQQLLNELASSQGNLLENKALIDRLNEIKQKSQIIANSLAEGHALQESLDAQREVYRPFARVGSTIFFLMSDLVRVNHMYQFSLGVFLHLFKTALADDSAPVGTIDTRIPFLVEALQRLSFSYVSRSLFKADRLLFGMHCSRCLHPELFQDAEWDLFLGNLADVGEDQDTSKLAGTGSAQSDAPTWVGPDRISAYRAFKRTLPKLFQQLEFYNAASTSGLETEQQWRKWARSPQCENEFPASVAKKITAFQRLVVVQTFRPDRLYSAMQNFVCEAMRVESLSPASANLGHIYSRESSNSEPILMITSLGADPSQDLEEMALKTVGRARFHEIAMGGGQTDEALDLLRKCAKEGSWLYLKNLHLVVHWVGTVLEKELNSLNLHKDFRLWLSTEAHPSFPRILLQNSLKITFEAPPGIKKNLLRTYDAWTPQYISQGSALRAQMLFVLAWFHALCQERRTFIPQGWVKFYEFSTSDLRAAADVIDAAVAEEKPDWPTIYGLLENAIYGGRVDNDIDLRVLRTYLQQFFNNETLSISSGGGGRGAMQAARTGRLAKGVVLPTSAHHPDYLSVITALPDSDSPAIFGLPANADRIVQRAQSNAVIQSLRSLSFGSEGMSRFDRDQWTAALTPILTLWQKIVTANQASFAQPAAPKKGRSEASPIDTFVDLEKGHGVAIASFVDGSLQEVSKVLRGASLLTPAVMSVATALLNGQTPQEWLNKWDEGPEQPIAFLRALANRVVALDTWKARCEAGKLLSGGPVKLNELFRPNTFLNALRQQTARELRCSMDSLRFACTWSRETGANIRVGVQVEDLLLQGCNFDGSQLTESASDAPSLSVTPVCLVGWVDKATQAEPGPESSLVSVPVYFTPSREKLLCEVRVPCDGDRAKWVVSSVSLFVDDYSNL